MRLNTPVTQHEYLLSEEDLLISRTDLKGRITYANPAFVKASGFSVEELIGADHNLVRHPDMPPEAFENFWKTLKEGEVWSGLVKNRRKNGDHYWVRASVVPVKEMDQVVGYASLRVCPSREDVQAADDAYRAIREGKGGGYRLQRGEVRRKGVLARLGATEWRSASLRTAALTLLSCGALIAMMASLWREGSVLAAWPMLVLGAGLLAILLGLGISIHRSITGGIDESRRFVLQVAAGNLTVQVPPHGNDDIGRLVEALATMKKGLGGIVADVNAGIGSVKPAVDSIRSSNEEISRRSDGQAASIQQTAASMEELTTTVQQNADNAQQASQLAVSNMREVEGAGEGMSQVVCRMQSIIESSRRMAEVVSVIDGIAFQTNILALNASVEAARAGDQGRGFAVVAGEVRNLASRSATAAKEIHQLIHQTSAEIDAGAEVVKQTEASIQRVLGASSRVNDIMEEISSASREQRNGIGQIGEAVNQMEQGVQQSAIELQSTFVATQQLQRETCQLVNAIRAFRTRATGHELVGEMEIMTHGAALAAPTSAAPGQKLRHGRYAA
ncbi:MULTISPECIES: methyl-accepting chemotaxis protein [Halomonadaceae]|uniref:methyl-accepting chemotaxis protein n=1 Tax=Halomonadaceae TaxID=28256 RepID=UPI001597F75D|nr:MULTISPECIES: methyl-accepting chemotaxis protein [Halomonas]QJQ96177.1 PAS domain-containing protein [Halomonas sp. PA5]